VFKEPWSHNYDDDDDDNNNNNNNNNNKLTIRDAT
jgi:hypothetical protein